MKIRVKNIPFLPPLTLNEEIVICVTLVLPAIGALIYMITLHVN